MQEGNSKVVNSYFVKHDKRSDSGKYYVYFIKLPKFVAQFKKNFIELQYWQWMMADKYKNMSN